MKNCTGDDHRHSPTHLRCGLGLEARLAAADPPLRADPYRYQPYRIPEVKTIEGPNLSPTCSHPAQHAYVQPTPVPFLTTLDANASTPHTDRHNEQIFSNLHVANLMHAQHSTATKLSHEEAEDDGYTADTDAATTVRPILKRRVMSTVSIGECCTPPSHEALLTRSSSLKNQTPHETFAYDPGQYGGGCCTTCQAASG